MTETDSMKNNRFCSDCGELLTLSSKYCSKCGIEVKIQERKTKQHNESFLIAISVFFTIVGGLIAYFKLRHDNPKLAKICLVTGVILYVIGFIAISLMF